MLLFFAWSLTIGDPGNIGSFLEFRDRCLSSILGVFYLIINYIISIRRHQLQLVHSFKRLRKLDVSSGTDMRVIP